jgi:hypothetical protein
MNTCRHCGGHEDVHHGTCGACRLAGVSGETNQEMPEAPSLEPPKDRPWVGDNAFTGRTRRNPRA